MLTTKLFRAARLPVSTRSAPAGVSSLLSASFSTASDKDEVLEQEVVPTEGEWAGCSRRFMSPLRIDVRGGDILTDPLFNKGTAFKGGERDRLRFRGLLPPRVFNMPLQKERFLLALRSEESTIRKHLMLEDLHDRNETLYHRVLVSISCFFRQKNHLEHDLKDT
jgi:hypothetical protein